MRHWIKQRTQQFLEQYPHEECQGAHIVLSDDNYSDSAIMYCLKQKELPLLPETRQYLEWLLTIPLMFRDPYYYSEQWEYFTFPPILIGTA